MPETFKRAMGISRLVSVSMVNPVGLRPVDHWSLHIRAVRKKVEGCNQWMSLESIVYGAAMDERNAQHFDEVSDGKEECKGSYEMLGNLLQQESTNYHADNWTKDDERDNGVTEQRCETW
jgi:hypothetical protein